MQQFQFFILIFRLIFPQALDQRFNVNAVAFLKELFEALIYQHNESTNINPLLQNMLFTKIKIVDGTDIQELTQPLLEGQSVEFLDIYIGLAKLKARLIQIILKKGGKNEKKGSTSYVVKPLLDG
ncbi:MAG TPA: hypothetical protein GX707_12500 [Epulopiscium sp.]|nr:hypothetical protein [Candidatus Epulonipiscium sp.]